jgi:hypothetical protein
MYSWDAKISVKEFLHLPFRTLSDGGFAGLVFLLARSADAPELQRRFFRNWADIDDLTGRYLGVFTPAPGHITLSSERATWSSYEPQVLLVDGVQCASNERKLYSSSRVSPWAVRMASERPKVRRPKGQTSTAVATSTPPSPLREHQIALTQAISSMQEFFGIPESLVPCVVVVSLQEQMALAIPLEEDSNVYQFLKKIKTRIEPVLPRIREKELELESAKEARIANRHNIGVRKVAAQAVAKDWERYRVEIAKDLDNVAVRWDGEEARLCRWMAARLRAGEPLGIADRAPSRTLLYLLNRDKASGRLPRRLRRALAKMTAGYLEQQPAVIRLTDAKAEDLGIEQRIGQIKAEMDSMGTELRLADAVTAATQDLNLRREVSTDLLPERDLQWPIKVLSRQPRSPRPTIKPRLG